MEINQEVIKELVEYLGKSGVNRFNLETDEFKLLIERNEINTNSAVLQTSSVNTVQVTESASEKFAVEAAKAALRGNIVTSPIVGTFYAASSPKNPPFVVVGQKVSKGDVVCIIESMKLMNEITSEFDGTVAEIYTENGSTVEYGQPLLRIE